MEGDVCNLYVSPKWGLEMKKKINYKKSKHNNFGPSNTK